MQVDDFLDLIDEEDMEEQEELVSKGLRGTEAGVKAPAWYVKAKTRREKKQEVTSYKLQVTRHKTRREKKQAAERPSWRAP